MMSFCYTLKFETYLDGHEFTVTVSKNEIILALQRYCTTTADSTVAPP